jgi:hypothetical protein
MGLFLELGRAVSASGKAVEHVGKGLGKVLAGVGGAVDTLGHDLTEAQRTRHETLRLREQHEFLLRYQDERAKVDEDAKQSDFFRDRAAADQRHQHRLERQTHKVRTEMMRIEERDRVERSLANSPFQYDKARVFEDARRESGDGRRPVLLIAPFVNDPDTYGMAGEVLRCTSDLIRTDVMGRLAGAFRRPLDLVDTDVNTIRDALGSLPGVLVSGDFDADGHVWVTVAGWDLFGTDTLPGYGIHRTSLPPVEIPSGRFSERKRREARHDVAVAAVCLAAVYAELFNVAQGRLPALYADLPVALSVDVAVGSAAMLDVAAAHNIINPVDAALRQARVYLDVGLDDRARAVLGEVVATLLADDAGADDTLSYLDRVDRAKALLLRAGLTGEADRLEGRAAPVARDQLLGRISWGA